MAFSPSAMPAPPALRRGSDPNAPLTDLATAFWPWTWPARCSCGCSIRRSNFASVDYGSGAKLAGGSGLLGDPQNPDVVVAPNGGADLIYLPQKPMRQGSWPAISSSSSPPRTMSAAVFVNDKLGKFPGALSMSDVNLMGSGENARSPHLCQLPQLSPASAPTSCNARWACMIPSRPPARAAMARCQPGRNPQFHGRHRTGFQNGLCRSCPDLQCRYRADPGAYRRHRPAGQRQTARAG